MNQLDRLLKAAARAPAPPPGPMPAGLATRVLAQVRAGETGNELAWLAGWCRAGLIGACAIMLVSLAWSYRSSDADSMSDLAFVNQAIEESALR
jgi:hypothetical protein